MAREGLEMTHYEKPPTLYPQLSYIPVSTKQRVRTLVFTHTQHLPFSQFVIYSIL